MTIYLLTFRLFKFLFLIASVSTVLIDAYEMLPRRFSLRSIGSRKYVSVDPKDSNKLVVNSDEIGEWETFEHVPVKPTSKLDTLRTLIAIKCVANKNYVTAVNEKELAASKRDISDFEKFYVYFGPDNKIGLRSKWNYNYVLIEENSVRPTLSVYNMSASNIVIFEFIPLDNTYGVRHSLPKFLALKSFSNDYYVHVIPKDDFYINTDSEVRGQSETFESIQIPNPNYGQNETIIALRSLYNDKYVSAIEDNKLKANGTSITETETFEVFFLDKDKISLRVKKTGKFVSAHPKRYVLLETDRDKILEWETFGVVSVYDRTRFPKLFGLFSESLQRYIHVDEDEKKPLYANSKTYDLGEIFEAYYIPDAGYKLGENKTLVALRSKLTDKFLVENTDSEYPLTLTATERDPKRAENFEVFYGSDNIIGLRAKKNGKFLCSRSNSRKPLMFDRDEFLAWEMFRVIEFQDKFNPPSFLALKSKANGKYIHVEENASSPLFARSTKIEKMDIFELIFLKESPKAFGQNGTLIALRSAPTRRYLSASDATDKKLLANKNKISNTEIFELVYGYNNYIGLKSKATGNFITDVNSELVLDRAHFQDWEMFEMVKP